MDHTEILAVIERYAGRVCGYDRDKDVFIYSICGQAQTLTGPLAREGVDGSVERLVRDVAEYRRDALRRELAALQLAAGAGGTGGGPATDGRDRARADLGEMIERCRRRLATLEERLAEA